MDMVLDMVLVTATDLVMAMVTDTVDPVDTIIDIRTIEAESWRVILVDK